MGSLIAVWAAGIDRHQAGALPGEEPVRRDPGKIPYSHLCLSLGFSFLSLVVDHVFLLYRIRLPSFQFIGSHFQNEISLSFWVVSVPKPQFGSCVSQASQLWHGSGQGGPVTNKMNALETLQVEEGVSSSKGVWIFKTIASTTFILSPWIFKINFSGRQACHLFFTRGKNKIEKE